MTARIGYEEGLDLVTQAAEVTLTAEQDLAAVQAALIAAAAFKRSEVAANLTSRIERWREVAQLRESSPDSFTPAHLLSDPVEYNYYSAFRMVVGLLAQANVTQTNTSSEPSFKDETPGSLSGAD